LIEYFAKAAASEFAHFAKVVLAQSTESALAGEIISEATEYLAALIENNTNDNQALFIDGGLATYYKPLLEARLKRTVEIPTAPAEYGAFLYAMNFL
jgi:N-acetylglucosamine kinase-like BadF-type ATPase